MKKAQLLVLLFVGALLISVGGAVYVQATGGTAAIDPLYPVVGAPLGTAYPYDDGTKTPSDDGYDIARDPNDVPSEALPDGASVTITA